MDTLNIKGLKVSASIGVHTWEQRIKQELLIDISMDHDFSACEDTLAKTVDYAVLCERVTQFIEAKSFQLIETLTHELADLIHNEFKVTELTVGVSKPYALKNAKHVQIITRR